MKINKINAYKSVLTSFPINEKLYSERITTNYNNNNNNINIKHLNSSSISNNSDSKRNSKSQNQNKNLKDVINDSNKKYQEILEKRRISEKSPINSNIIKKNEKLKISKIVNGSMKPNLIKSNINNIKKQDIKINLAKFIVPTNSNYTITQKDNLSVIKHIRTNSVEVSSQKMKPVNILSKEDISQLKIHNGPFDISCISYINPNKLREDILISLTKQKINFKPQLVFLFY